MDDMSPTEPACRYRTDHPKKHRIRGPAAEIHSEAETSQGREHSSNRTGTALAFNGILSDF